MIRPQAGLLLRSLGAGGARPAAAAVRSATSLLLGAALATAFFLLYTSLCRDIGGSPGTPPPRWERREAGKAVEAGAAAVADREVRDLNPMQREHVAREEERRKVEVTHSDGDGGGGHGARKDEENGRDSEQEQPQQIVMPSATSTPTEQVIHLPLPQLVDYESDSQNKTAESP